MPSTCRKKEEKNTNLVQHKNDRFNPKMRKKKDMCSVFHIALEFPPEILVKKTNKRHPY